MYKRAMLVRNIGALIDVLGPSLFALFICKRSPRTLVPVLVVFTPRAFSSGVFLFFAFPPLGIPRVCPPAVL